MSNGVITSSVWGKFSPDRNGLEGRPVECKDCGQPVIWIERPDGKKDRVGAKDDRIHWKVCPAKQRNGQQTNGGTAQNAGPVWIGAVELDDSGDPEWYVVRVKCSTGDKLKAGDLVKLMRRQK